jgi:hypothetical protein
MRFLLSLLFVFPLIADDMALSVDEAFPDPYACYDDDCDYDDDDCCYDTYYDADIDGYWDDQPNYPSRQEDELMDNLTNPW